MNSLRDQWLLGWDDLDHVGRVATRLALALVLGALVGFNRERVGKAAGLRTHMLVSLGAALFVLVPVEAGVKLDQLMRVIQGVAAGIGFLGAGAILKLSEERKIHGLTTAATIWLTAAVGLAAGMGYVVPAVLAVGMGYFVLIVLRWFEPGESKVEDSPRE